MCILYSISSFLTLMAFVFGSIFFLFLVLYKIIVLFIMDDDLKLIEYGVFVSIICHVSIH